MQAFPIERFELTLTDGIRLDCRTCGPADAPFLLFLHGFPEAAFVWDALMQALGPRYRCVAPNLRGYAGSSRPEEVAAYRASVLLGDLRGLIAALGGAPEAVIAHDWGGALAWGLALQSPELVRRLVILNAPHPGTFLRELRHSPQQQRASAYMNWLCRPDAAARLAAQDFRLLRQFFSDAADLGDFAASADRDTDTGGAPDWLDAALLARYREVWRQGLDGALNYYRASPLRPAGTADPGVEAVRLAPEALVVKVPTLVLWGLRDRALPAALLDGLDAFVPELEIERVPDAGHWIVHEQPALLAGRIAAWLARGAQGRPMKR